MSGYNEIIKLQGMLDESGIGYDLSEVFDGYHISVSKKQKRVSIIEHIGSYGSKYDLLEVMKANGDIVGGLNAEQALEIIITELVEGPIAKWIEELKELREYKKRIELQYLDDINNPLEPLKLYYALESELYKYNYRKEHKPNEITMIDYTIMHALKHCLDEQCKRKEV